MFDAPPERGSFGSVQLEYGFLAGPADGRYLIRPAADAEPEFVVVLATLGAPRRGLEQHGRRLLRRRRPRRVAGAEPTAVPITRAGVVYATPLGSVAEAEEWLRRLRSDRDRLHEEVERAVAVLNGLMRAYRAAAANPYARDLQAGQTLSVRVGHGTGPQVADGRFATAYELPPEERRGRRAERLSPQERLAAIAGGRDQLLAADELVLRARADVAADRPREAALQTRIALESVLAELGPDDLGEAGADLDRARAAVSEAATAALDGEVPERLRGEVEAAVRSMERALRKHRHGRS